MQNIVQTAAIALLVWICSSIQTLKTDMIIVKQQICSVTSCGPKEAKHD